MQRHAALVGIGEQLGRRPYIDSQLQCTTRALPELAATMPNFHAAVRLVVSLADLVFVIRLLQKTGKERAWPVPFNLNVCQFVNASM